MHALPLEILHTVLAAYVDLAELFTLRNVSPHVRAACDKILRARLRSVQVSLWFIDADEMRTFKIDFVGDSAASNEQQLLPIALRPADRVAKWVIDDPRSRPCLYTIAVSWIGDDLCCDAAETQLLPPAFVANGKRSNKNSWRTFLVTFDSQARHAVDLKRVGTSTIVQYTDSAVCGVCEDEIDSSSVSSSISCSPHPLWRFDYTISDPRSNNTTATYSPERLILGQAFRCSLAFLEPLVRATSPENPAFYRMLYQQDKAATTSLQVVLDRTRRKAESITSLVSRSRMSYRLTPSVISRKKTTTVGSDEYEEDDEQVREDGSFEEAEQREGAAKPAETEVRERRFIDRVFKSLFKWGRK